MARDDSTINAVRRARFQALAEQAKEFAPATDDAKDAALGVWAEDQRGAPNVVLRSALFTAGKPTVKRKLYRDHVLPAAIGTRSISYTGPQLYQYELDVWLELVHRCRTQSAGSETTFHAHGFLRSLRRNTGSKDYKQLVSTFRLLQATAIDVVLERDERGRAKGYVGSLVDHIDYDEAAMCWKVRLDPEIAALFAPNDHTWLQVDARLDLGRNYLAKWLHGYFSSHRKPHPISVHRLHELSGSGMVELRRFRFAVRAALAAIGDVERGYRRRFEWRIDDDDCVHVTRESGN